MVGGFVVCCWWELELVEAEGGFLELKIAELDSDWILEVEWSTSALFAGAAALVGRLVGRCRGTISVGGRHMQRKQQD